MSGSYHLPCLLHATVMYEYIVRCVIVVLQDIDKGHYAESDQYVAHAVVTKDRKNVFLATDK